MAVMMMGATLTWLLSHATPVEEVGVKIRSAVLVGGVCDGARKWNTHLGGT
jgi:hypothetical protein